MTEEPADLWGLPRPVYDELVATREGKLKTFFAALLYPAILIGGFVMGIFAYVVFSAGQRSKAWDYARTVDGWSVSTDFGIALIFGVFWWICVTALICYGVVRLLPMPLKGRLLLAGQKKQESSPVGRFYRGGLNPPSSAAEAVDRYSDHQLKRWLPIAALVGVLIVAGAWLETRRFQVIAPDGLHTARAFSADTKIQPWSNVTEVALGCNWTNDGAGLIYEAVFRDGSKFRFSDSNRRGELDWLDGLERVDAALVENGATFKRWTWLSRDPMHPKCLQSFYGRADTRKSRIDRLLRTGKL